VPNRSGGWNVAKNGIPEKLHPKLRMIGNGSNAVNYRRAELSGGLVSTLRDSAALQPQRRVLEQLRKPRVLLAPGNEAALSLPARPRKARKLKTAGKASNAYVNVFIEVQRSASSQGGAKSDAEVLRKQLQSKLNRRRDARAIASDPLLSRNFIAATVPVTELENLRKNPRVAFVQPSEGLSCRLPTPKLGAEGRARPSPRAVKGSAHHKQGAGTIIGIIDVGGFDFAHPDFADENGGTRFIAIWDQGGKDRKPPERFQQGSEITKAHMDSAIRGAKAARLPATEIERQSQQSEGSHGTHVASIAAGRSGVCPKAMLAAVLIDIPQSTSRNEERRTTFSDSFAIVQAVEYLLKLAEAKRKPISINISLGTNGGAHDGSSGVSRWLDAALAVEGRSICVAAGNAGQEAGETEDDLGWVMGRIHSSGRLPAAGLAVDLEWTVVGNTIVDVSENELEIWYPAQDRIEVQVKPPGAGAWITVKPQQYIENQRLESGTFVSIYNELYHPVNGCNYAAVYLSPDLDRADPKGVQSGVWTIRLRGDEVRDGRFHCWIERDDPYEFDRVGQRRVARFPSFFSARSNVDSHSINSLSCGHRVIAVANLHVEAQRIAKSSSQGPTRDDRQKPDIAAPGTDIVAANGFGDPEEPWVAMSGTSMASPYVAGVIGLMLAANPRLTAAQCTGILQRTSRPLPGADYTWRNDAGFGQIDPEKAVLEAKTFARRDEIKP
jgi:subtilisin family serine protease